MGLLGSMSVKFGGDSSGLTGAVSAAKNAISGLASTPLGAVGAGLLAVGAMAVGVGVQAVKMAGDFQQGMTTLVTGAGESSKNIKMVSDGILKMAVDTGTTTQQLTSGMFMIESAGYHGAAGLQVLQVAAEGAKVGNADLGVTANALTTMLTDYHMKTSQSADAMNGLNAVVANGKTHLQDVAGAMGSVLPLASSLGIAFPQVGGAISTMTNAGMSAQRASMNLANAIRSLAAPGASAQKSMKEVGISAQQLHDTLSTQGLTGALQLVESHVNSKFPAGSVQATAAMKAIMGGATGLNVSLMLGGKNMQNFEGNVKAVADSMKNGKGAVTGWSDVQNDFNFKMDKAKEVIETLMIKIGTALLPVLGKLMDFITPLIDKFGDWITKSGALQSITDAVGTGVKQFASLVMQLWSTVGPLLIGIGTWLIKSGALSDAMSFIGATLQFVIGTIGNVISAISAVIGFFVKNQDAALALMIPLGALGGYFVFLGVQAVVAFIAAAPAMIAGFITGATAAWGMAAGVLAATWPFLLIGAAIGLVIAIVILLVQHWGAVTSFLQGAWANFTSWLMNALHAIGQFFVTIWNGIISFLKAAWAWIVNAAKVAFIALILIIGGPILWIALLIYFHWNQIKSFLAAAWAWVVSTAQGLWANVIGIFQNAWHGITGAVLNIWNWINNFFGGLPGKMLQFGINMIQGLINGIGSMLGAVGNAVSGVANTIKNFLGFHSPAKQGPGSELDIWGPNLVKGFAAGIQKGIPQIQAAVNMAIKPVKDGFTYPQNTRSGYANGGNGNGGGNNQPVIFTVEMDGKEIARKVAPQIVGNMRLQAGVRA